MRSNDLPDGTVHDTKEGPCAICLEETITNPVVMPCGHVFCFACVAKYQETSISKEGALCPYCRGEIPDVGSKALERSKLYFDRAAVSPKGSEEQQKYAKLSLAELDSLIELEDADDTQLNMIILSTRLNTMSMAGQPEEAIKVAEEVLSLVKRGPIFSSDEEMEKHICTIRERQAEACLDCGKWNDAAMIYTELFNKKYQLGVINRHFIKGLIQANYELGKYDEAIEMGNVKIKKFRHSPGVHKYVALAHKAKGNIDEAKKTMSRAILYEYHWNKDNMQKNKELLKELNNL